MGYVLCGGVGSSSVFTLSCSVCPLTCCISWCDSGSRSMVMTMLDLVNTTLSDSVVLGDSFFLTRSAVYCCVDVASQRLAGALDAVKV